MKNLWLVKAGLAIGLVMAGGLGRAETTRELRDGKYWIDVPQGETYTLAESDVDVLVPDEGAQPELWKIGPGTLEMTTNGLANCAKMMSYNADIYATNGLLRTLSEYALGKLHEERDDREEPDLHLARRRSPSRTSAPLPLHCRADAVRRTAPTRSSRRRTPPTSRRSTPGRSSALKNRSASSASAMSSRPKSHPVSWLSYGETNEENQR